MLRYDDFLAVMRMEKALCGYPMRDAETVGGWDVPTRGTYYGSGVPLQQDEIREPETKEAALTIPTEPEYVPRPGEPGFIGPLEYNEIRPF